MKKIYISGSPTFGNDYFTFSFKRDASEMGYQVLNRDQDTETMEKHNSNAYLISQADIFIAVISDKSPNVFYELGYATALGKKVLIVSDIDTELPSDIKQFTFIRVDNNLTNSAYYNVFNFLEKARIEEKQVEGNIKDLKSFLIAMKENPQIVDRITASELEDFFYNYFREIGVSVDKPKKSIDYGFDLTLYDWENHKKTIVEVKKHNKNSKVAVNTIQQVIGVVNIYEADHALIITTSEFTSSAKEYASTIDRKIELWDLDYLFKKIL